MCSLLAGDGSESNDTHEGETNNARDEADDKEGDDDDVHGSLHLGKDVMSLLKLFHIRYSFFRVLNEQFYDMFRSTFTP
jgi:hypothetical protein